jgi:hypothetical protein
VQALQGPGTTATRTITNVLSDVFFYSIGGFRGLRTTTVEQELREGQLGEDIKPLTDLEIINDDNTVAVWLQSRGEWWIAVNRDNGTCRIYVLKYTPSRKLEDWSYFEIERNIDYLVELDGVVYFRGGDKAYFFKDDCDADFGTDKIPWRFETHFFGAKNIGAAKHWLQYDQTAIGKCKVYALYDTDQTEPDLIGIFDGDTLNDGFTPIAERSQVIKLIFEGEGAIELESFEVNYKMSKARAR